MKKRIGIFGGSFNPVHAGHLMLASWIAQSGEVDEVWLMLSPCNPLKVGAEMASDDDRLKMLEIALKGDELLKLCSLELEMPRPSYTINTLYELESRFTDCEFVPIVGSDNLTVFDKWRDHDMIIARYGLIVYPRQDYPISSVLPEKVRVVDAPMIDVSSTKIRELIRKGWNMNFFLPPGVYRYIVEHGLYK